MTDPADLATIVLLHGFTQTGRSWDPVVAAMGERYRALAPDLRGHGAAAAARPVGFAAIEADVLALAPPRFALAGYSMGGRIALDLALRDGARAAPDAAAPDAAAPDAAAPDAAAPDAAAPDDAAPDDAAPAHATAGQPRVERLALIGASPGLRTVAERAARRAADAQLADAIEREGVEPFARRWAAQPLFAGQPPAVAAAAHAERLRSTPAGLAASLRGAGSGAMEPLWERLPQLRIPVALIVGERDGKFRAIAEQMAALIPQATLHVVAGAGHAVQLEQPEAVAALL